MSWTVRSIVCCRRSPYKLAWATKEGKTLYVNALGHFILAASLPFDHTTGSLTLMLEKFVKDTKMSIANKFEPEERTEIFCPRGINVFEDDNDYFGVVGV